MVTLYFAPMWIFITNKYAELNAKGFQRDKITSYNKPCLNIFRHCHLCFVYDLLKITLN